MKQSKLTSLFLFVLSQTTGAFAAHNASDVSAGNPNRTGEFNPLDGAQPPPNVLQAQPRRVGGVVPTTHPLLQIGRGLANPGIPGRPATPMVPNPYPSHRPLQGVTGHPDGQASLAPFHGSSRHQPHAITYPALLPSWPGVHDSTWPEVRQDPQRLDPQLYNMAPFETTASVIANQYHLQAATPAPNASGIAVVHPGNHWPPIEPSHSSMLTNALRTPRPASLPFDSGSSRGSPIPTRGQVPTSSLAPQRPASPTNPPHQRTIISSSAQLPNLWNMSHVALETWRAGVDITNPHVSRLFNAALEAAYQLSRGMCPLRQMPPAQRPDPSLAASSATMLGEGSSSRNDTPHHAAAPGAPIAAAQGSVSANMIAHPELPQAAPPGLSTHVTPARFASPNLFDGNQNPGLQPNPAHPTRAESIGPLRFKFDPVRPDDRDLAFIRVLAEMNPFSPPRKKGRTFSECARLLKTNHDTRDHFRGLSEHPENRLLMTRYATLKSWVLDAERESLLASGTVEDDEELRELLHTLMAEEQGAQDYRDAASERRQAVTQGSVLADALREQAAAQRRTPGSVPRQNPEPDSPPDAGPATESPESDPNPESSLSLPTPPKRQRKLAPVTAEEDARFAALSREMREVNEMAVEASNRRAQGTNDLFAAELELGQKRFDFERDLKMRELQLHEKKLDWEMKNEHRTERSLKEMESKSKGQLREMETRTMGRFSRLERLIGGIGAALGSQPSPHGGPVAGPSGTHPDEHTQADESAEDDEENDENIDRFEGSPEV